MSHHHKKCRIELRLENSRLQELIEEQLKTIDRIDQSADMPAQLLITDTPQMTKPDRQCLVIGKDIPLPVKLGELKDKILYTLSGRDGLIEEPTPYRIGQFTLQAEKNILIHEPDGKIIRLTDKERLFLRTLYEAEHQKLSRKELLETVWGYAEDTETHTLETHLYRLRQKLEPFGAEDMVFADGEGAYGLKDPNVC